MVLMNCVLSVCPEIRNPKHEIRNNTKIRKTKTIPLLDFLFLSFIFLIFEFVSSFDIRASDLQVLD